MAQLPVVSRSLQKMVYIYIYRYRVRFETGEQQHGVSYVHHVARLYKPPVVPQGQEHGLRPKQLPSLAAAEWGLGSRRLPRESTVHRAGDRSFMIDLAEVFVYR